MAEQAEKAWTSKAWPCQSQRAQSTRLSWVVPVVMLSMGSIITWGRELVNADG